MKRSPITLITGLVLIAIFVLLLFAFQVRQTDVAIVTTFGKYSRTIDKPGLYAKLPWPIQRVYQFDNRLRSFESRLEQTATRDGRILLVSTFVGWRIADPRLFLERFDRGDLARAGQTLEAQVRDTQSAVVAQHAFADFISTNAAALKFVEIEQTMLTNLKQRARDSYGIDIQFAGIKQIGLPESITAKVFERMKEERQQLVKQYTGEGEAEAIRIRAEADRQRQEILSKAEAEATVIKGEAEREAAKSLAVFEKNPKLANFLLDLKALEASLKDRATLILDQQTPPFNLLRGTEQLATPKR
ncbi:MAG TPA: protease modulator HflC [Verrucomicrobiae bacterium]|jgi:membrane protease subunit HflC